MLVGEAALVAHPVLVDLGVEAGAVALHLALVVLHVDVAAAGAAGAEAVGGGEQPDAGLEAEVAGGQCADGAEVGDAHGVGVVELTAGEGGDLGVVAALLGGQLAGTGNLVAEADAAGAEDAALAVEDHVGANGLGLALAVLGGGDARRLVVVRHVVVLEFALAGLVADGAVDRVVHEDELEDGLTGRLHAGGLGVDDRAFGALVVAGGGEAAGVGGLDQTHPAVAGRGEGGVVAEVGDVHANLRGGPDDGGAGGDSDLLSVDGKSGHGRRPSGRLRHQSC